MTKGENKKSKEYKAQKKSTKQERQVKGGNSE